MDEDPGRSRRSFLAAVGAGALAGLAGCSDGSTGTTTRTTGTTATTTTTRTTRTTTEQTATTTSTPEPLDETVYSQFRGDLQRRGYFPDADVPRDVTLGWRVQGINKGDHTAAKASFVPLPSGDLIVPGDTGVVYRLTPEGETVWVAATHPSSYGIHGTPAVANGTVYVGAYDGAMYAFDAETGERRWRTKLGDAIGSSPAYHDGIVYIAVEYFDPSGSMWALDARTGEPIWEGPRPESHPHSTCAIDPETGMLVVGSNDFNLYGWTWPDLEPAWQFETGEDIKGPIAVHDGTAYFGSWDSFVYAVDVETGEQEWFYTTGHWVMSGPSVDPDLGRLYIGSHDNYVHAIDLEDGTRVWREPIGGWAIGCPTVVGDLVLCGSVDRKVVALDRERGERVWAFPTRGWATSTPRVVDGAVYFTEMATDTDTGGAYKVVEN